MKKFRAFNPELRQDKRSGGFIFTCEVTESEWEEVKDINDPGNHNKLFYLVLISKEEAESGQEAL